MEWEKLLNPNRLGNRQKKTEIGRSPFDSDRDKITFSGAFRRLARKTQVHPLATNDHVHNRLTHSLEVACVGRSLGALVGLKLSQEHKLPSEYSGADIGDIVQATCLAHDIGNPPFGHTGEEAMRSWFSNEGGKYLAKLSPREKNDIQNFEGNAQGFRVLTTVENHINDGGMRLTYATLASFIKYPWTSQPAQDGQRPKKAKYGIYTSELDLFHEVADATGLIKQTGDDWYCRHPLVHLMESADDFCYGILDLEDGLEMGILKWEEIYEILLPVIPNDAIHELEAELSKFSPGRKPSILRGKVISAYIDSASTAFTNHESQYLLGDQTNLIELCDENIKNSILKAKEIAKTKIFNHPRKIELEVGSYNALSTLLSLMSAAAFEWVDNPKNMSFRSQRILNLIGESTFDPRIKAKDENINPHYLSLRRVIDFIGGMTDNYATHLSKQFNGMGM